MLLHFKLSCYHIIFLEVIHLVSLFFVEGFVKKGLSLYRFVWLAILRTNINKEYEGFNLVLFHEAK